ncbi:DUF378 domain-containing protein [Lihuaxuella thermophila]|uniref:DUF378 domain-containing protein n=1 Tax=Lihuaxuella thermophila TaxID=1173111 RepID=A0A1H8DHJ4_9BACL|nr:DUF378 domain-containing protein [Lihuaxuella thermophila]SEN06646.1 hypothetical protein SAMN05444955_105183 [Lihuaxuella thermophila]
MARLALTLVILGALNWLLIGIFQWDFVAAIFGGDVMRESSGLSRVIYAIIGIAGIYAITFLFSDRAVARNGD